MENTGQSRVFIALGANLEHPIHGAPRRALEAALEELGRRGVVVRRVSPWYRTAPVPASDQPWYVNAVAEVATGLAADALLMRLHEVEDAFGRVRTVRQCGSPDRPRSHLIFMEKSPPAGRAGRSCRIPGWRAGPSS